jgi:spermidine synthase
MLHARQSECLAAACCGPGRSCQASRSMNHALLFSVFIVASCGLAYELIAGALASYLLGDSVTQFSTVIGTYLFAMGIGSWLSRYVERHLVARFIQVELMVGVLGGFSAAALFFIFVWSPAPFKLALYLAVFGIGVLVGLEIPLIMRILKRDLAFKDLVSQVLTFDYLGALAVSILFPVLLVPHLGLVRSGLLFGLLNVMRSRCGPGGCSARSCTTRLAARTGGLSPCSRCSWLLPLPAS